MSFGGHNLRKRVRGMQDDSKINEEEQHTFVEKYLITILKQEEKLQNYAKRLKRILGQEEEKKEEETKRSKMICCADLTDYKNPMRYWRYDYKAHNAYESFHQYPCYSGPKWNDANPKDPSCDPSCTFSITYLTPTQMIYLCPFCMDEWGYFCEHSHPRTLDRSVIDYRCEEKGSEYWYANAIDAVCTNLPKCLTWMTLMFCDSRGIHLSDEENRERILVEEYFKKKHLLGWSWVG